MRCFDNRYAKATEAPTQKKIFVTDAEYSKVLIIFAVRN